MDTRLALITLLFFSQNMMPSCGQGCLDVEEIWTESDQASVDLQCTINAQHRFWKGTNRCDPQGFTRYECNLTESLSCMIPRRDYENEPVTVFCCSSGEDLVSSERKQCFDIMMCPNATVYIPSAAEPGDLKKVYITHIAKPPTPIQPPTVSVTLLGSNLTHLPNRELQVTNRTIIPSPLNITFIFSFKVPSSLPDSTMIQLQPFVAKGSSSFCNTPDVHDVQLIEVLVGEGDSPESTQPPEMPTSDSTATPSLSSTDTSCTCPVPLKHPGVIVAVVIVLLVGTIISLIVGIICSYCFLKRKNLKTDKGSASFRNGNALHSDTPSSRPHPSNLPLKRGTPTEEDKLISTTSSLPTDTPTKHWQVAAINYQFNSPGSPTTEVERAPHPQCQSNGLSPSTPSSCLKLPLPSPVESVQQSRAPPFILGGSEERENTPHYEIIQQQCHRVNVFGERNADNHYGRQGDQLILDSQHSRRKEASSTATFV